MSATWTAVVIVGAATIGLKSVGTLVLQGRELPARLSGMIELLAPVMLAALVVTNTFGGDHKLVLDARAAGLAAAAIPIALRAPLLVTVVVAAATAAIVRAI
ncbi:MAG TPA: AzlD domain-containing protein [Thermoleophilaceae bacterium]